MTTTRFNQLPGFEKDFKRLRKKYQSLPIDFQHFCRALNKINLLDKKGFITLEQRGDFYIIKARMFCFSLRRKSLRIIFCYQVEKQSVDFIEIYFKGDKASEDSQRIKNYLRSQAGQAD